MVEKVACRPPLTSNEEHAYTSTLTPLNNLVLQNEFQ
jgi:hypothetical protein